MEKSVRTLGKHLCVHVHTGERVHALVHLSTWELHAVRAGDRVEKQREGTSLLICRCRRRGRGFRKEQDLKRKQ